MVQKFNREFSGHILYYLKLTNNNNKKILKSTYTILEIKLEINALLTEISLGI